jgi:hypothetical protein
MNSAIDLFRAGVAVLAGQTNHDAVSSMRTVCPECLERVHLVVRTNSCYFAHDPWNADSPACQLRIESDGSPRRPSSEPHQPHEPLPPNTRFRDALLAAYSLTEPPETPSVGATIESAAAVMHRVCRDSGRTVTAADFPDASPFLQNWWGTDEAMIQGFLERPGTLSDRLREDLRGDPELQGEAHRRSVLLLWKHLHLPQVAEDLHLLLRVTASLFRPALQAELVVTSLGVLSWVHWNRLWASLEHVCDDCGRTFALPLSEKPAACSECSRSLCPDCAIPCSGCGDILCDRCVFRSCPACSEPLCETCWHFEWQCTSCDTWYCEGGLEEQPEEVEKIECDGCHEPFCADCAEEALQSWEGETLCESCREERQEENE